MSTNISEIKLNLLEELGQGDINLPSLPSVAQRIQSAFEDQLATAQTIGVIIQSDPIISAKMIRVANSPLYAGRVPIEDVNQAVARLGMKTTQGLVMGFAVKDLFHAESRKVKQKLEATWKESVHVASLCRILSERLVGFDKEQAQLAGLVHNIGAVVILNYLQDKPEILDDDAALDELMTSFCPVASGLLLKDWSFAEEYTEAGAEHGDWMRDKDEAPDLCDLVIIARYHAMIGTRRQSGLPPINDLPAFKKTGMNLLSIKDIISFLESSREKLKSISASLGFF